MTARLPKILVALALAGSIGLHWTVLQAVAWASMIVSYSQEAPLGLAVAKTFDGQHPCQLCKQIAKGKQSEKKPGYNFELKKLEFPYATFAFIFRAPSWFQEMRTGDERADLLMHAPAAPPPEISSPNSCFLRRLSCVWSGVLFVPFNRGATVWLASKI